MKYTPSRLAGAALILALKSESRKGNAWTAEMEKSTGIHEKDLTSVAKEIKSFAEEINKKFLTTLIYKFSKPQYFQVGEINLRHALPQLE